MDDMYRELIIDHYKNPRHHGSLDPADVSYEDDNPLCGDRLRIDLRINGDNQVVEAAFSFGEGAALGMSPVTAILLVLLMVDARSGAKMCVGVSRQRRGSQLLRGTGREKCRLVVFLLKSLR